MMLREDQHHTYVLISTSEPVIWLASSSHVYHASLDALRAVCNRIIRVYEDGSGWSEDRSNSVMTCIKCAERVRRLKTEPKPVDVNAAIKRHAARELGVLQHELGKRFS